MKLPDQLSPVQVGVLILVCGGPPDEGKIAEAIGVCTGESGRRASNSNSEGNSPPSTDRGAWMFNSYWQEDVPDSCAYDWACSTREMLKLSRNLTDFSPWYAYHEGVGDSYRSSARRAIAAYRAGRADKTLGASVGGGGGAAAPASTIGGGGELVDDEQRAELLKGLVWTVLVLGGVALAGLGLTRALGAGRTA